jgi:hypothetical protein
VTSAQISITIKPFDENMLKLSFPYDEPTIAAHKRNTIAGVLGACSQKDNQM